MKTPPITRWTDNFGVRRCSHWPHSYAAPVATTILFDNAETVIGDPMLADLTPPLWVLLDAVFSNPNAQRRLQDAGEIEEAEW